jgi:hypothetical protein
MDINAKNVGTLIRFMDGLNDPRFSMKDYFHDCGAPACALGWATTLPEFAAHRNVHPIDMAETLFGKDSYWNLFNGTRHESITTPQQWAEHARAFLKENGWEAPSREQAFSSFMEQVLRPVEVPA